MLTQKIPIPIVTVSSYRYAHQGEGEGHVLTFNMLAYCMLKPPLNCALQACAHFSGYISTTNDDTNML